MALKRATKEQAKLRLAIYGISGSGKTYSALAIAQGLGKRIAVLDTEYKSASKYAKEFTFDTDDFGEPTIDNYLKFINMVREVGAHNPEEAYDVLIIDSLSHAWQTLLEEVDDLKENKYKGNQMRAWAEVTPKYKRLVNAILSAPFHVIGTMRAKTEWSISKDGDRTTVRRDGLAPEQKSGFEYEFDMLIEINSNHVGMIIKDRTGRFQDKIEKQPGREFGLKLLDWFKDGTPNRSDIDMKKRELWNICKSVDKAGFPVFTEDETKAVIDSIKALADETPERQLEEIENALNKQKTEMFERMASRTPEPPAPPSTPPQAPPETKAPPAAPPTSKKPAPPAAGKSAGSDFAKVAEMIKEIVEILNDELVLAYADPAYVIRIRDEVSKSVTLSPAERVTFVSDRLENCRAIKADAEAAQAGEAVQEEEPPEEPQEEVRRDSLGESPRGGFLSQGFQDYLKNKQAKRSETVESAEELDIF